MEENTTKNNEASEDTMRISPDGEIKKPLEAPQSTESVTPAPKPTPPPQQEPSSQPVQPKMPPNDQAEEPGNSEPDQHEQTNDTQTAQTKDAGTHRTPLKKPSDPKQQAAIILIAGLVLAGFTVFVYLQTN